ncbi:MAG: site-2 protease family protein, partial [Epsilonproteobacteria bacterium]|nr:site-2 protease family protein [Campylobacterota bacterium]
MNFDLNTIIGKIPIIIAFIIAIVGHEVMHGYTAYKLGDPTAKILGRLSINPLKHIDPIGSLIVPGIQLLTLGHVFFGWAKPVPINMHTIMKNGGENGAIKVSLAGVTFNFTLVA